MARVDDSFLRLTTRAGFAAAGSLGVRGFISAVCGAHHEERVQALREALQSLREQGVRRVHTVLEPGDTLEMAARDVGFGPCPGETLFQREVACPPSSQHPLPESFTLRNGRLEDLLKISNELTHVPELAFQGWEKLLIGRELDRSDRFFKVKDEHSIKEIMKAQGIADFRAPPPIPTFIDTSHAIDELPEYDAFEPAPDDL